MSTEAPQLFGTDGIRGPFGEPPLDRATVEVLGYRLGSSLLSDGREPCLILGGDTRASTPTLANWIASGMAATGARCRYAGVLPTPGISVLTRLLGLDGGIAISASHNPFPDNGIKLFDAAGFKWSRLAEVELETAIHQPANREPIDIQPSEALEPEPELADVYLGHLAASLPSSSPLEGMTIALDCANGAASPYADQLFRQLGARVHVIADRPDGTNINLECGSTGPKSLADLVTDTGSNLGIAFDGDADRAVLVDESGAPQDGDSMLYLWARELRQAGRLEPSAIVATTMSNLGLEHALAELGVETVRCDVGDRVVVETMRDRGILLGGEQSGHIVHLDLGSTGDGLLTALQMSAMIARSGESLSSLAAPLERFPQILVNVRVKRKPPFETVPSIAAKAKAIDSHLGGAGRLLLRYSGTEPLARVMIEGRDLAEIEALGQDLATEIGDTLGGES